MEQQAGKSNRYRIIARLCSGGMADIFLGVQVDQQVMDRLVVIKKVHSSGDVDEESASMFADEARIISTLNHPHVIQIFDFSEENGNFVIVMEYIDGENLGYILSELRRRKITMPKPVIFRLMTQALEALQYIHTAVSRTGEPLKIVHRDLDPRNLMIDRNGYLKIIDFGVAKAVLQSELTAPGLFKGKLSHVAPELITQQKVDHRADIYAIGLVLFEMMVGQKPYHFGKDVVLVDAINRIVEDPIPKPSSINPDISPSFDSLILRACAKDRTARFSSAKALQRALEATLRKEGLEVATNAEVQQWFAKTFSKRLLKRQMFENQAIQKAKQHIESSLSSRPTSIPGYNAGSGMEQIPDCFISGPDTGDSMRIPTGLENITQSATSRTPISQVSQINPGSSGQHQQVFSAFQNDLQTSPGVNRDSLLNHQGDHAEVDTMQSKEDSGQYKMAARRRFLKIAAISAALPITVVAMLLLLWESDEGISSQMLEEGTVKRAGDVSIEKSVPSPPSKPPASPAPKSSPISPSEHNPAPANSLTPAAALTAIPSQNGPLVEEIATTATAAVPSTSFSKSKGKRRVWNRNRPSKRDGNDEKADEEIESRDPIGAIATAPEMTGTSAPSPSKPQIDTGIFDDPPTGQVLVAPEPTLAPQKSEKAKLPRQPVASPSSPSQEATSQWLSGNGNWNGPQVAEKGCTNCHALNPSSKTTSQWKYFFSHNRHRKYKNLKRFFSDEEIRRVQSHLVKTVEKKAKPKSGIAGIR